jgi:hypothetical protein
MSNDSGEDFLGQHEKSPPKGELFLLMNFEKREVE